MDKNEIVKQLTILEKATLVAGTNFMYTNGIDRLGIPSICMADGPHGLRKQTDVQDNGTSKSEPATAFPTAVTTASSWNPNNVEKMGQAIAKECVHYGVNVLLGPGVNIKRNPLCGRNFEYFSEDPLLTSKMATAEVQGIQNQGVGVSVKHFAANNSENYRFMGNSIVDERAMREIYLKAFENVVKQAKPCTVMCAYNQINGTYCSQNEWLLTEVLRNDWGFDGLVMTDWGAMHDRVASLKAGLDLEMPGDTDICKKWIVEGLANGSLEEIHLNNAVYNVLSLIEKVQIPCVNGEVDFDEHHSLAGKIAEDCAVLLKNDGVLPLCKEKLLIVGDLFDKMRYQGAGSSMINPTKVVTTKIAFDQRAVNYVFCRGYEENKIAPNQQLIDDAVQNAKNCDKIVVFAGLTDYVESEGCDRENMRLPQNQLDLITSLCKVGKQIVVVLYGGSVMELPFAKDVNAILNMFLPGQNGGTATANLLFGDVCPSGKLAETWAKSYADVPFGDEFGKGINEIYKESVFVGYRYYLTAKKDVLYPFGYGLSYTQFDYADLSVETNGNKITASCKIANVGKYDGAEVVQLYVQAPQSQVFKPIKELRGFEKVYLNAGKSKVVNIAFDVDDLRFYDASQNKWVLEKGDYVIQICSDCQAVKLSQKITLNGETVNNLYPDEVLQVYQNANLPAVTDELFEKMSGQQIPPLLSTKPITLESRFSNLPCSFMGKILYNAVMSVATKQLKKAKKMIDGAEKDNCIKGAIFMQRVLQSNSLMSMSMCAGKTFPYNFAEGFMHLANGKLFKGIKCFCTKIKIQQLKRKEDK